MTLIDILVTQITFKVTLITLIVALMTLIALIQSDIIHVMINCDSAIASNNTNSYSNDSNGNYSFYK